MNRKPQLLLGFVLIIIAGLAFVPTARADRATRQVAAWYQRNLDRYPDPGAREWVDRLRPGQDPLTVEASILASDEYWYRAGGNTGGWIDLLFRDTVGRPPSERDYRFWSDRARFGDRNKIAYELLRQLQGDRPWN
jgi:hypothetical protein